MQMAAHAPRALVAVRGDDGRCRWQRGGDRLVTTKEMTIPSLIYLHVVSLGPPNCYKSHRAPPVSSSPSASSCAFFCAFRLAFSISDSSREQPQMSVKSRRCERAAGGVGGGCCRMGMGCTTVRVYSAGLQFGPEGDPRGGRVRIIAIRLISQNPGLSRKTLRARGVVGGRTHRTRRRPRVRAFRTSHPPSTRGPAAGQTRGWSDSRRTASPGPTAAAALAPRRPRPARLRPRPPGPRGPSARLLPSPAPPPPRLSPSGSCRGGTPATRPCSSRG